MDLVKFTVIPDDAIGIIEACDGAPLPDGRVLAHPVDCDNFQDARAFLLSGQRGLQMSVIPPGSWRINTLLFTVSVGRMTVIEPGKIGMVEARDGEPISGGRVIGRAVGCDSFQDPAAFMRAGVAWPADECRASGQVPDQPAPLQGPRCPCSTCRTTRSASSPRVKARRSPPARSPAPKWAATTSIKTRKPSSTRAAARGLQEQVLLAGRYFINPMFATVEIVDTTEVPIASVGVVVAYVGKAGEDVTGEGFRHANMVLGRKGVWVDVLDPGKYAINPYTHKIRIVPTANVVLNWATGKTEAHKLDANLSTIVVRSADGFTFNLDVSQIIHIPRNDAPKVIARFGSMEALVTQVLEPTIGNYFRNAAQNSDVIDFPQEAQRAPGPGQGGHRRGTQGL